MATKDDETSEENTTDAEVEETEEQDAAEDKVSEAVDTDDGKPDDGGEGEAGTDTKKTGLSSLLEDSEPDVELEAPEGVDPRLFAEVVEFAKANGLNQEQAAAVLGRETAGRQAYMNKVEEDYCAELKQALVSDPKIGGSNLPKTAMKVKRLLGAIGGAGEELLQAMDHPVFGFNRVLLGALAAAHDKYIAEDTFVDSKRPPKPAEKPKLIEDRLFPNEAKKAG